MKTYFVNIDTEWLLTQNVQSTTDGLDGLLGMYTSSGCDHHSLQTVGLLLFKHLIVVEVSASATKVFFGPVQLMLHRRRSGDNFGARSESIEVVSVTSTHAAEASDGDFEGSRGHCVCGIVMGNGLMILDLLEGSGAPLCCWISIGGGVYNHSWWDVCSP